jgi:hypothetical protein
MPDMVSLMLDAYPRDFNVEHQVLVGCTEACVDCPQARRQCPDNRLTDQPCTAKLAGARV